MSVIVAKGEQICKAPTNTSKTKFLFSFAKSKRFPEPSSKE